MKAAIYRLRSGGIRLPRPDEAKYGNLLLNKTDLGEGLCARLQMDGKDMLPPLFKPQVTRITQHGMVLKGRELSSRGRAKSAATYQDQTWWVLVQTEDFLEFHEDGDPLDVENHPGLSQSCQTRLGPST